MNNASDKEIIKMSIISLVNPPNTIIDISKLDKALSKYDENIKIIDFNGIYELTFKNKKYLVNNSGDLLDIVNQNSTDMWNFSESYLTINNEKVKVRNITSYIGPVTEEIVIPNYLDGIYVERINGGHYNTIFENNNMQETIKKINISDGIKYINMKSFANCPNIEGTIIFPNSINSISSMAFLNCRKITGIQIGNNVAEIGISCFINCSSLSGILLIPDKIQTVSQSAFQGTSFNKVVLGSGVNVIGMNAFNDCKKLESIIFNQNIEELAPQAFHGCSSLSGTFYIPSSIKRIGSDCFGGTNISKIVVDNKEDSLELGKNWNSGITVEFTKSDL